MRKYSKVIALVLALIMVSVAFFGCNNSSEKIIGKVDGMEIPEGVFINNFFNIMTQESSTADWEKDFKDIYGKKLYDAMVAKKVGDKTYFDTLFEKALEESRLFMIEQSLFSKRDGWPDDEKQKELKENAESYIEQMITYYGSSFGTSDKEEFVQAAYGMSYEELLNYFFMSACTETYKQKLQEAVTLSDEELLEYYKAHAELKTVQVRHSLLNVETDATEEEKEAVYTEAKELVDKYNAGEITFDDIMKKTGDVDDEGNPNNDGYYTVYDGAGFVEAFEAWGVKQTEVTENAEIVETEYGYHIMICTKIIDTTDETVRDRVQTAYIDEAVNSKLDEEIEACKDDDKYKIKNYNKEYAQELAKKAIIGEETDSESEATNSESEATATTTAAPSEPDAAADTTVIAKYKENPVYKAYYSQFFSQAMNTSLSGYDFSELEGIEDEKEYYAELKKVFYKEYKDGKSYIEYAKDEALNLMLKFFATKEMAIDAEKGYTDEEVEEMLAELDSQIDSTLAYYGGTSGISTRDDLVKQLMGMNVNDYKNVYIDQMLVNKYSEAVIEEIEAGDSVVIDFYKKDADAYRVVSVRTITKSLLDSEGNEVSSEKKAEILKLMQKLKEKIKDGDSGDALVSGYSDSTDTGNGLSDLTKATKSAVDSKVFEWAFNQTEVGAVEIIECESSYELVIIEGLTDYYESKGISAGEDVSEKTVQEQVKAEYKNYAYEDKVEKYIKDNNIAFADVDEDVINQVIDEYLAFTEIEEETESEENTENSESEAATPTT
ncbi:MAG: hypothetical protein E7387_05525 [Ruminococcaceae bacterium]|nr:hypothetical protein [Oscillospiraceae bacterium]